LKSVVGDTQFVFSDTCTPFDENSDDDDDDEEDDDDEDDEDDDEDDGDDDVIFTTGEGTSVNVFIMFDKFLIDNA